MKNSDHLINFHNMIFNQNQHAIIIKITVRIIIRIKIIKINNFINKIKIDFVFNFSIKYFMFYQFQITIAMKTSSNSISFQLKIKFDWQIFKHKTRTIIQIINCNIKYSNNFCKKSIMWMMHKIILLIWKLLLKIQQTTLKNI